MSDLVKTELGKLPSQWRVKRLGDSAVKIQDGTHFSPRSTSGPYRYITSKNIRFGRMEVSDCGWISEQEHDAIFARCDVHHGDVLLTKDGANTGNAALNMLTEPFSILSSVAFIRTDEVTANSSFVLQYLLSPQGQQRIKDLMAGNAITRLTLEKIKDFCIPLPPIEQQRKIAKILTTVDNLIEKTEALIAKYQAIKQGMMHDLFTRGVDEHGRLRPPYEEAPEVYKESELGWIPRDWAVCALESLLKNVEYPMRSGPFGSSLLKSEFVENGIPFLGIDNVYPEYFSSEFNRFVSSKKFQELRQYAVRERDVMITVMGTVGRCCIIPEGIGKALSSKHVWTMTFDESLYLPELICWQLNYASRILSEFERCSQGGVMAAISSKTLKTLKLPYPQINEQQCIFSRYRGIQNKIKTEQKNLEKHIVLKTGLMQDLLTGKVRVNVEKTEETSA